MPADTLEHTELNPALADTRPGAVAPLAELVSGIVGDVQTLIRQQAQMLRAEVKEDFRRGRAAAAYVGAGLGLAAVGVLFLVIGLVYLLQYLTDLHPFACWLIVGGVLTAAGLAAAYAGKKIFEKHNPLPDKTFNALTENLTWTSPNPK
jgi:hypothetical protein